jgi:hypothetical protein
MCNEDGCCALLTIALMMGATSTSETSPNFYQTTRHNNPEANHIHARRPENLKSHLKMLHVSHTHNTQNISSINYTLLVTTTPQKDSHGDFMS